MMSLAAELRLALRTALLAPRVVMARVLVEASVIAGWLCLGLLLWRALRNHLLEMLGAMPLTLTPGSLLAADSFSFLGSRPMLLPFMGSAAALTLLATVLRFGQRAAEIGTLASRVLDEDDPPMGYFESLVTRFDKSVVLGCLQTVANFAVFGFVGLLLFSATRLYQAGGASGGSAAFFGALGLAFAMTLSVLLVALTAAVFSLALSGSLGLGWRPLVAPVQALGIIGRHPLQLLGIGIILVGVRLGAGMMVAAGTSFSAMLPVAAVLTPAGLGARAIALVIGLVAAALVLYFSEALLFAFVADDAGRLGVEPSSGPPTSAPLSVVEASPPRLIAKPVEAEAVRSGAVHFLARPAQQAEQADPSSIEPVEAAVTEAAVTESDEDEDEDS